MRGERLPRRVSSTRSVLGIIQAMADRIVARFDPERIILFGSHARGTGGPDSDVDLLVVMPVADSKRRAQLAIRLALRDFRIPKDIIVTTARDPLAWATTLRGRWQACCLSHRSTC